MLPDCDMFVTFIASLLAVQAYATPLNTNNQCESSPCGKNAICERTQGGIMFCKCPPGFTGDPFVACQNMNPSAIGGTSEKAPPTATFVPITASTAESLTSTLSVSTETTTLSPIWQPGNMKKTEVGSVAPQMTPDLSRIPITEDSALKPYPNIHRTESEPIQKKIPSGNFPSNSNIQQHTYPVLADIPVSASHKPHHHNFNPHFSPSNSLGEIVRDPLGKYTSCVRRNGIVICADTSTPQFTGLHKDTHLSTHSPGNIRPASGAIPSFQQRVPVASAPVSHSVKPKNPLRVTNRLDSCSNVCGTGAICRMVLGRPVCGCPEGHTGNPAEQCRPLFVQKEECIRHQDCAVSEICEKSKCINPCQNAVANGVSCGSNTSCQVVQHTLLCGCLDGYYGNPYLGCAK